MFTGLGYNRKTTTVTYKRKPRFDPVVHLSSDDDSDLDEPVKVVPSSRSPQIMLENNSNTVSIATTQNPMSNVLNNKKLEDKSYEDNEQSRSSPATVNNAPQQFVVAHQPPKTLLPLPHQPVLPAPSHYLLSPQQQQEQLQHMPPLSVPSYPLASIAANEQQINMLPLGTYTTSSITQAQQLMYPPQQQVLNVPCSIPSQPLPPMPYSQLDALSWTSTYEQSISMTSMSDPFGSFQSQQQQSIADCTASNTLSNNDNNNATDKERNVVQANSRLQNQQQAEPAPSDNNSPAPSVIDIFDIPELPNTPRRAAKVLPDKQQPSSSPSSQYKKAPDPPLPDVFDISQVLDNVAPNQTTKRQPSPSQNNGDSFDAFDIPEYTTASRKTSTAKPSLPQTNDDDDSFDVFDFPEKDDANILELKLVSTPLSSSSPSSSSASSSSSRPASAKQPRNKSLKRSLSQVNSSSSAPSPSVSQPISPSSSNVTTTTTTTTTPSSRPPGFQRRTTSRLEKSKSYDSTTSTTQGEGRRVRFAPEILVSTFYRMSFDRSEPIYEPTTFSKVEEQEKFSFSALSTTAAAAAAAAPPSAQPPAKRKRNLVSRLRSATGEQAASATSPSLRRYNFDDDDDDDDDDKDDDGGEKDRGSGTMDATQTVDEDEQEYRARMERELVAIMESEFGQDDDGEGGQENAAAGGSSTRPHYQPKNSMNVRVTYQRKNKHSLPQKQQQQQQHQGHDREMAELDNLLDKLRAGGSDL